ncbi:MAG: cupredoxin domain-containing protein [Thiohalocapsa sp.]
MRPLFAIAVVLLAGLPTLPARAADPVAAALTIRDHQYVPAEVTVPAGVKVELTIRNEQAVPAEFESTSLHREKVIPPGAAASVFIGPLQPGRYEFFDDFHPATRGIVVAQ